MLPCFAIASDTAGSLNAATTASWTFFTVAGLIPFGPITANQASTSKFVRPCSAKVGMFGAAGVRCAGNMPIGRSLPLAMCPCTLGSAAAAKSTCPPSRSVTIGPTPLYGMCLVLRPAASR